MIRNISTRYHSGAPCKHAVVTRTGELDSEDEADDVDDEVGLVHAGQASSRLARPRCGLRTASVSGPGVGTRTAGYTPIVDDSEAMVLSSAQGRLRSAPDLHLRIGDERSPALIRRALRELLGSDATTGPGQSALLVCSELVNNVLGHTTGGGWLSAWWIPDRTVRLEAFDTDPSIPPLPAVPAVTQLHGRGLHIVDTVATRWGIHRATNGKTVWCEIDWPRPRDADVAVPGAT